MTAPSSRTKQRLKIGLATAIVLLMIAVGLFSVYALDAAGLWDEVVAFAFTVGVLTGMGGWGLSYVIFTHFSGGFDV